MKIPRLFSLTAAFVCLSASGLVAQVTLTGTNYTQDFNSIESGLPSGWSVYSSATSTTLGTSATFYSTEASWASTDYAFRNVASNTISFGSDKTNQDASNDRALGWRPVSADTPATAATRAGAVTFAITNTLGLENFSVSMDVFQLFNTSGVQTYVFEYRVGDSGAFTQIGSAYTTKDATAAYTDFNPTSFSANSITLAGLNNQSETVYFRLRGTTTAGTTNLDLIGVDNFSLSYTAVPEPSTYAAILGAVALVGVAVIRHRKRRTIA